MAAPFNLDPTAADQHQRRRIRLGVGSVMMGLGLVMMVVRLSWGQHEQALTNALAAFVGGGVLLWLIHVGRGRLASHVGCGVTILAVIYITAIEGGLDGAAAWYIVVVPVVAGLLLDWRASWAWSMVAIGALWLLGLTPYLLQLVTPQASASTIPVAAAVRISALIVTMAGLATAYLSVTSAAQRQWRMALRRLEVEVQVRASAEHTARQAEQAAREAERTKSDFLATMSHEIRTPLHGVMGSAALLQRSNLSKEDLALAQIIARSSANLRMLLDDVLDLSKLEAGEMHRMEEVFEPRTLVRDVIDAMQVNAQTKGIVLESLVTNDVPARVSGDPHRLRQILLNLIGNAIKFTAVGEVRLQVDSTHTGLEFMVEDTGIGMSQDALSRVFEPFTQADASTTRRYGGTGLGLDITRRLVTLLDGTLSVDSIPGDGTTFVIRVPVDVVSAEPVDEEPDLPKDARSCRILVVDDNPVNLLIAQRMLMALGHDARTAENGEQAVNLATNEVWHVIFMDCQMPVMDGIEATGQIRALTSPRSNVPIVGFTASALPGDRERLLEAGMNDVVTKPVAIETLGQAVVRWMDHPSHNGFSQGRAVAHLTRPEGANSPLLDPAGPIAMGQARK